MMAKSRSPHGGGPVGVVFLQGLDEPRDRVRRQRLGDALGAFGRSTADIGLATMVSIENR